MDSQLRNVCQAEILNTLQDIGIPPEEMLSVLAGCLMAVTKEYMPVGLDIKGNEYTVQVLNNLAELQADANDKLH